jgi:two-component system phosphate regulon sensor histidine kinase PhoR
MKADPWKLLEDARTLLERALADGQCGETVRSEIVRVKELLDGVLGSDEPTAGEVLRILGHELKSPITALSSLLRTVEEGYASDPVKALELVGRARRRADELVPLVNDILELGSLASHPFLCFVSVDLQVVVEGVHDLLFPMMVEGGVGFTLSVPSGPVLVSGVESHLRRVFQNLCVNAFKYNRTGGSVHMALFVDSGFAVVTVSDTGVGIPAEDLPHVFGLLYRGSQARRNPDGGLGLGLSLVQQIVEVHGGTIDVSSVEGQGTVMTVRLPLSGAPPPVSAPSTP